MKTFYLKTSIKIGEPHDIRKVVNDEEDGTISVPLDCEDVPDGSIFLFASDSPNIKRVRGEEGIIYRKIHNSSLLAEYAYFKTPQKEDEKYKS